MRELVETRLSFLLPNTTMSYLNYWTGVLPSRYAWVLIPLIVWSLIWKGWALWKSARIGSKPWFVVLLILNTAGILDILYIFLFSKKGKPAALPSGETHV